MSKFRNNIKLIHSLMSNPQIILVSPAINVFLARYMNKFTMMDVGGQLILHSHLPAINSPAFTRFIKEQLLNRDSGPSHAQIAVTDVCPQNCQYCYNKNRSGTRMETEDIKRAVQDLKKSGVIWLGLTGGEPLINPDLAEIVESIGPDCAVKLFTTGYGLTEQLAADLKRAGLFSVAISLDHWIEQEHDRIRGFPGAYQAALSAIEILKKTAGIHISVSTVVTKDMNHTDQVETFIKFLKGLGIHELWLSEAKPTVEAFQKKEFVITEDERLNLVSLQDRYNHEGKITINYLGHFEGREHFGCNAGNKMVYIDAFGEVSPCVFLPMTFGNIKDRPLPAILDEMRSCFPSEGSCFINKNYDLVREYGKGQTPISREDSLNLMRQVRFGPMSKFSRHYYRRGV